MQSASVLSACTRVGSAIAATILSATFVSDRSATGAESWPSTAETQKLHYLSWAKFCERDLGEAAWRLRQANEPVPRPRVPKLIPVPLCFTVADARTEAGQPVVAVALIEREGAAKGVLRVTLPYASAYGPRISIDEEPPLLSKFYSRFATDYEATPELVDKLKKGQKLQIQAAPTILGADALTFALPLADGGGNTFAGANEGPPGDPKMFEALQKMLANGWYIGEPVRP